MKMLPISFIFLLIASLAACGGSTSSNEAAESSDPVESAAEATALPTEPTAEPAETPFPADSSDKVALVGLWDVSLAGEHGYIIFTNDGSYFVSLNQETIIDEPRVMGEYWLEEGQLHLRDLENAGHWTECIEEGVYDMAVADDGTLTFVTIEDNCDAGGFTRNYVMENTKWTYMGERQ